MIHPLLRAAYDALRDPATTKAIKEAAGGSMTTALKDDLPMPVEYVRAAWRPDPRRRDLGPSREQRVQGRPEGELEAKG
jgi:hypothetical protein